MKKFSFWTRILLLLCFIVFCSSNGWAWNRVYLIGGLTEGNWDSDRTSYAFIDDTENGKSYYEVSVTAGETYYFAVYIDQYKHRCGPNTSNADIKQNTNDENYHRANNNDHSWKITPTTNKIKIWSDQSYDHDETPWIWVEETGSSEIDPPTPTPTPTPSNTDYAYYLVGNFFDNDPANEINYDRRYFKFNIQSNGKYMVEIPAAVTARAQIIGVTDVVTKFGPKSANYDIKSDWPETDQSATGEFDPANTTNYWNLTTRNDNTLKGDDDGLYEVWFKASADGTPTEWEFKHVSTRRVAYFLSTAPGATVNPVYNERQTFRDAFSNKTYAMVYINPEQSYYTIGYVLREKEQDYIDKANNTVSGGYGAHVNNKNQDVLPTTNKLFLMGNNGRTFKAQNPYNEVSPHVAAIKVDDKQAGLYKVEYNPSNGNNEWAKGTHSEQPNDEKNTVGIRGQIIFKGGQAGGTGDDDPITSVSLVGDPVGTWDYTSTAHDMTYNEKEGCYEITINLNSATL